MKKVNRAVVVSLLSGLISMALMAEDTELFVADLSDREGYRPKVLIIFDNSGSMASNNVPVQDEYDPSISYPAVGSDNSLNDNALYYTLAGIDDSALPVPSGPNERRRLDGSNNACAESLKPLAVSGRFTGYIREFVTSGRYRGTWREMPNNNGLNVDIIDCLDDMNNRNTLNPYGLGDYSGLDENGDPIIVSTRAGSASSPYNVGEGYPFDSGNRSGPLYTSDYALRSASFHRSRPVTLYTANYLRWYHGAGDTAPKSRLAVAKQATENLIQSVPGVDFGLMIFNLNFPNEGERDGGRVIRGIEQSTTASHQEIIDIVNSLDGNTNTPLCETLYEAKRYFGGETVQFGDDDSNYNNPLINMNYQGNKPASDSSAIASGSYISPFDECADIAYVILVTDGMPTLDDSANTAISALDGVTATQKVEYGSESQSSYLAALANYMHNNDIYTLEPNLDQYKLENQGREPKQTVTTYTIGFGDDAATSAADLLRETAIRGGGQYFEAADSVGLESALYAALVDILLTDSSMTSPAIAANNFDRTRSLDNIYYSMFLPGTGPRWYGNIKKLKMDSSGILVDKNNLPAIDANGNIKDTAVTFWDQSNDALFSESLAKDGVNAGLTTYVSTRKIFTDVNGGLVELDAITQGAELAADLGVEETAVADTIKWIYGTDVDDDNGDGSTTDTRLDLFGDPFHSKPLVLNMSTDPAAEDLRIVVGTNAGQLHFFRDYGTRVVESWSFLPEEFLASQNTLRVDAESSNKLYGIDGSPMTYKHGDKTFLYFGLRRGGTAYFALNITDPDSPSFMWKVDATHAGFEELGQSWGRPVVTFIPGYVDVNNAPKPVVIISGGYDTNKDTLGVGSVDSVGRGIFMLDAETGALIWSASPRATTTRNKQFIGFTDSIPAAPAVLDSDGDGLTDRVYLADTGGNVWRLDLYGINKENWSIHQLAELGGDQSSTDRRFFYTPTITRTVEKTVKQDSVDGEIFVEYGTRAFDAILVGSGDRTRPASSKSVDDYYFMLKDENIFVASFGSDEGQVAAPSVIAISGLADIADDPMGSADSDTALLAAQEVISQARGWRYLLPNNYEKAIGDAIVLQGSVYFTTFTPPGAPADGVCVQMGAGRVYSVTLQTGTSVHSWRSVEIGERVPDTLVVHSGVDEQGNSTLRILGVGQGDEVSYDVNGDGEIGETETVNSGNLLSGASMDPKKVHTHEDESR